MYIQRLLKYVIAIVLALYTTVTAAQTEKDKDTYVGLATGSTKSDSPTGFGVDTSDSGVYVFWGYRLQKYFGVEVGFSSLGEYKNGDGSYTESFKALSGRFIGFLPVYNSGLSVSGHAGYGLLFWERKIDFLIEADLDDSGDTLIAGVGINYELSNKNKLTFRLGYDYFYYETTNPLEGTDSESHSLEMTSLSASLYF